MRRELSFRSWDGKEMDYDPVLFGTELGECFINSAFLERANHDGVVFMQYTGLKDKKGKKIYEGDIVSQGHGEAWEMNFEVRFLGNGWWYFFSGRAHAAMRAPDEEGHEVIGNIHEHPHLLAV